MSSSLVITEKEPGCIPFLSTDLPCHFPPEPGAPPHPPERISAWTGFPTIVLSGLLPLPAIQECRGQRSASLGSMAASIAVRLRWVCLTTSGHTNISSHYRDRPGFCWFSSVHLGLLLSLRRLLPPHWLRAGTNPAYLTMHGGQSHRTWAQRDPSALVPFAPRAPLPFLPFCGSQVLRKQPCVICVSPDWNLTF